MIDRNIRVPVTELELAFERWYLATPHGPRGTWVSFLGSTVEAHPEKNGYWATEEAYRKIMMLNGPHWRTVLKAWLIKEGYEK